MQDVKIETESSGMGQVAQGQCLNVRGGVSTLAVPGLECLALSTDMLSWGTMPEQACMLPQPSVQPNTRPLQDPLWVYGSRAQRLGVYNVILTSLISFGFSYVLG